MQRLLSLFSGPNLKQLYPPSGTEARDYQNNGMETLGHLGIRLSYLTLKLSVYASPVFLLLYLRRNGMAIPEPPPTVVNAVAIWGILLVTSYVARFVGRFSNSEYMKFAENYAVAMTSADKKAVAKFIASYDFDFDAWPVDFRYADIERDSIKPRQYLPAYSRSGIWIRTLPCSLINYVVANTLGIRLLYPGTILTRFLDPHLLKGRSFLVLSYGGQRAKLETKDGNHIDTMFVDRRKKLDNGDILVLCCEGNAGYYEIGIMNTPLEAGYSVIGWNHPGFGGSTGLPHPSQELNAVDTVMQYALKLGFTPDKIIVYAWSIGGFSSSWLVMNYPEIKSIIVDASFDDVVHLAKSVMPDWLAPVVSGTIKAHLNLNNAEQLKQYPGPIRFVRRTLDEVICTSQGDLGTNRGNDLALKVLAYRYPQIFSAEVIPLVREWFGLNGEPKKKLTEKYGDFEECVNTFEKFGEDVVFPTKIGENWELSQKEKFAIYLLSVHMTDFDRTHCIPLPSRLFLLPWDIRDPKRQ